MKIRELIFVVIFSAFGAYLLLDSAVTHYISYDKYKQFDRAEVIHRLEVNLKVLNREVHHLDNLTHDWAAWDDTYAFVDDLNTDYIDSNLTLTSFTENEINSIHYIDTGGKILWGKSIDLKSEEPIALELFAEGSLPVDHPLLHHQGPKDSHPGFTLTSKGPLLISSRPIVTSESEGPIKGSLIMAKLLDSKLLEQIKKQTDYPLDFWTISPEKGHYHINGKCPDPSCLFDIAQPENVPDLKILKEINARNYIVVREKDEQTMFAYGFIKDFLGENGILFRTEAPMKISALTRQIFLRTLISSIAGGLLVLMLVLWIINRSIVKPINTLTAHAEKIRSSGSMKDRVRSEIHTNNEIGSLADEMDSMVSRLADAQRQLVDQSYFSGMNEVASGVMHNIRNALNPVVVDISIIREELDHLPLEQLKMARKESEKCQDADRLNDLSLFVDHGLDHIEILVSDTAERLTNMTARIDKIEQILVDQEKFAKSGINAENIALSEVLKSSLTFFTKDYFSGILINIDESVNSVGTLFGDKNALIHILTNFLNNSAESIISIDRSDGRILVSAETEEKDARPYVHIKVEDNGSGITKEALGKIFTRGFSTKNKKTSGVGLHWCANTVAALEGTIYAESDGTSGTVMHLLIPKNE